MNKKLIITLIILSPIFWFILFISISLFLFYWRIANEPGLTEPIKLLWASRILFILSFSGTATINVIFIKYREKKAWIAWMLNLITTFLYLPIMFLTLFMMA